VRGATEAEAALGGGAPAALVTIQAVPGRPMEAIRAMLGLSQPGVLRLVERLERAGLIERRPPPGSRSPPRGRRRRSGCSRAARPG
jgi:DNA-binding MarR family transcriptional regulator